MDAAEIARLREKWTQTDWYYVYDDFEQVLSLLDALEQARKERDEWQAVK